MSSNVYATTRSVLSLEPALVERGSFDFKLLVLKISRLELKDPDEIQYQVGDE